jgi:hypothetical protein
VINNDARIKHGHKIAVFWNPTKCRLLSENLMFIGPRIVVINEEEKQLNATQYFIPLVIGSTCFGHHYAQRQELATVLLSYHMCRLTPWLLMVGRSGAGWGAKCPG